MTPQVNVPSQAPPHKDESHFAPRAETGAATLVSWHCPPPPPRSPVAWHPMAPPC